MSEKGNGEDPGGGGYEPPPEPEQEPFKPLNFGGDQPAPKPTPGTVTNVWNEDTQRWEPTSPQ